MSPQPRGCQSHAKEEGLVSVKHHPAHYVNIVDMTLIAVLLLCGLIYGPAWLFMVVEELYTLVCIYLGFFKKKKYA